MPGSQRTAENPAVTLRRRLANPATLLAPFVYDGLQARLCEQAGFEAVYMSGFGTAAALGRPDMGLIGLTEMSANVEVIARSSGLPAICDADTGYGDEAQVRNTVEMYQRAGAAALHLEDQVWPKRCGYLDGKQVVPIDDMTAKLRAACAARSTDGPLIIGRTDALAVHGWDEAERRARAYIEAGADLAFVDGIHTEADLDTYAQRLEDVPLVYNGHMLAADELAQRGFRIVIHSGTMVAAFEAFREAVRALKRDGTVPGVSGTAVFAEIAQTLNARI